jgi:hypothetical protein
MCRSDNNVNRDPNKRRERRAKPKRKRSKREKKRKETPQMAIASRVSNIALDNR